MADVEPLAALDLGSNSFHLIVAQQTGDRIQVIDKIKEMVRLAAGLGKDNRIDASAEQRALACLSRFGERLRDIPPDRVRVVGTNTLRKADNSAAFIARAEAALGHEIEIISGREEARLVYLGAAHSLEDRHDRRLVVDIGGGSTEVVLGSQFKATELESLYFGCVGLTEQYFSSGNIDEKSFANAIAAARQELEPVTTRYTQAGWDSTIGTSGTINAAQTAITRLTGEMSITLAGLNVLKQKLIEMATIDRLDLPGVAKERAASFPGGLAALIGVFEALELTSMTACQGALREGLLFDLLGRRLHMDVREQTVRDLQGRYHIDTEHGERVSETALSLLSQVAVKLGLTRAEDRTLLAWSAKLHEIGLDIAHAQYHKHGAYLLQNMDMAGFSQADQRHLAFLVRTHRRKFPKDDIETLDEEERQSMTQLALLLRLAVLLHRNRSSSRLPHIQLGIIERCFQIDLPDGWIDDHPLTARDLDLEAQLTASVCELAFPQHDKSDKPKQKAG